MFSLLNGASLNGGPGVAWVTVSGVVQPESVTQAFFGVIKTTAVTAEIEAQTSSTSIRYSFFEGGKLAQSLSSIDAVRLAKQAGTLESTSEESINVTRYAIAYADAITGQSTSSSTSIRSANPGLTVEESEAASSGEITRIKGFKGRYIPALALTWCAESEINRLRVRQDFISFNAIARSNISLLANTKIGQGVSVSQSTAYLNPLRLPVRHAFTGTVTGTVSFNNNSSRIRIISMSAKGSAEIRFEPTIDTALSSFSYNSGLVVPNTADFVSNAQVIKKSENVICTGESSTDDTDTFLIRGMKGLFGIKASTVGDCYFNKWVYGNGYAFASAITSDSAVVLKAVYIPPHSLASSSATIASNRVNITGNLTVLYNDSELLLESTRYAYAIDLSAVVTAEQDAVAVRVVKGVSSVEADAVVENAVYKEAYVGVSSSVLSTSTLSPTHNVYTVGVPVESTTTTLSQANRTAWMSDSNASIDSNVSLVATRYATYDGTSEATATESNTVVKKAYQQGSAVGQTSETFNSTRYAYPGDLTPTGKAISSAEAHRTAWYVDTSSLVAQSNVAETAYKIADMKGSNLVDATINCAFTVFHWEYFEGQTEGEAKQHCDGLRWTFMAPEIDEGVAVGMKFVYRINAESNAPDERVMSISKSDRLFILEAYNREYVVQ